MHSKQFATSRKWCKDPWKEEERSAMSNECSDTPSMRAWTAGLSDFWSVSASMLAVREGGGDGLPSSAVETDSVVPSTPWGTGAEAWSVSWLPALCEDCPKLDFKPSMKLVKPPAGVCEVAESEAPPELPDSASREPVELAGLNSAKLEWRFWCYDFIYSQGVDAVCPNQRTQTHVLNSISAGFPPYAIYVLYMLYVLKICYKYAINMLYICYMIYMLYACYMRAIYSAIYVCAIYMCCIYIFAICVHAIYICHNI